MGCLTHWLPARPCTKLPHYAAECRKVIATLWASIPRIACPAWSFWAVQIILPPWELRTLDKATVGGIEKGPGSKQQPEELLIRSDANLRRMGSKCGPLLPHWFITRGMNRWVAKSWRGSLLRRSIENLVFSPFLRTQSALLNDCSKVDNERIEETIRSRAISFAWLPHTIT
jgi:hypothetical protein